MSLNVHSVDLRESPPETLPQLLREQLEKVGDSALLWTARRPKKRWFEGLAPQKPLLLASSPMFEQIFWLPTGSFADVPQSERESFQFLLGMYGELFKKTEPPENCPLWHQYNQKLRAHISRQEEELFPELTGRLDIGRALQELKYEHRGLERGLDRMPSVLRAAREGELSSKEREMFDLDFYHLLEHHAERELQAVYPIQVFLNSKKG